VGQIGDLIFDSEFLALKFRDQKLVRAWSVLFFDDLVVQVGVFGLERFDAVQNGHCEPSFPAQIDDQYVNATLPIWALQMTWLPQGGGRIAPWKD
jgi:hypothetical protein